MFSRIINSLILSIIFCGNVFSEQDLSKLYGIYDTPVQGWKYIPGDEYNGGELSLGGYTIIYGFNIDEINAENKKVNVKINSIANNSDYKPFCVVGEKDGYLCHNANSILDFSSIPNFDVDFYDVENINIDNDLSGGNKSFSTSNTDSLLDINSGNYNDITIDGDGVAIFPIGHFKINKLELKNSTKVVFQEGSSYEINQISIQSWGGSRISLTSYADVLTVKDATFSNAELYLKSGNNRFERLTITNGSTYKVNSEADVFFYELNINNGSLVYFEGIRSKLNFKAKQYRVSGSSSEITFEQGVYYIYYYDNGSSMNESVYFGDVTIVTNKVKLSGSSKVEENRINIFSLDDKGGEKASFEVFGSANICANIFSRRKVSITENGMVIGAVVANKIEMNGIGRIRYYPDQACSGGNSNQENYQLQLTPTLDYSLICQPQRLQFQVLDSNNQPTGSFAGSIDITPSNANLTPVSGKGSGSDGRYTPNSAGELWLELRVPQGSGSQTLTISGTLNPQGSSNSVTGTYHFVPYKFATEEQYVIANKPQKVEVKVLACNDDGDVVDVNYSGTPQVSSAWVAPTSDAAQGDLTFTPVFTQGVANSELTMEDSGHKTVALEDDSFDCSELGDDCPIEGKAILKGSFEVYARPWTLAICSPSGHEMNGDIIHQESVGFAAAGAAFDLHLRPLRWVSDSSDKSDPLTGGNAIETSEYCNSPITQNFFFFRD
ncbi:MAG: DUF6701 domain-containing protein [Vibrio sp.]